MLGAATPEYSPRGFSCTLAPPGRTSPEQTAVLPCPSPSDLGRSDTDTHRGLDPIERFFAARAHLAAWIPGQAGNREKKVRGSRGLGWKFQEWKP